MFVILAHQEAIFRARGLAELRATLTAQVRAAFPAQCAGLDAEALQALVADGMRRAAAHGLTLDRDLGTYVDLMIVFGPSFEDDPGCPWARPLLDATHLSPSARLKASFEGALLALAVPDPR
jgi:hypothetical protein